MAKLLVAATMLITAVCSARAEDFHKFQVVFSANDNVCQRINNYYNEAINDMAIVNRYEFDDGLVRIDVNNDNIAELVHKHFGLLSGHETQWLEIYLNNPKGANDCLRTDDRLSKTCEGVFITSIPREDVYLDKLPMQNKGATPYIELGSFVSIDVLNIDRQNYVTLSEDNEQFNIKGSKWIILRKYDVKLNAVDICYILDEYFTRSSEE